MRLLASSALVLMAFTQISSALTIEPCLAERQILDSTNNDLAMSSTQILELRSQLTTEQEHRENILLPTLKDLESRLDSSNQALLHETEILNLLNSHRVRMDRLFLYATHKSVPEAELQSDLQVLAEILRVLGKSSRSWRALVGQDPANSLLQTLERIDLTHQNLIQSIIDSPNTLADYKRRVNEAQNMINSSLNVRRDKESRLNELERRVVMLKQNLPVQRNALNVCTRRAQFGE